MPSPGLAALAEPFERVLDAFGFRRERSEDRSSLVISCEWGARVALDLLDDIIERRSRQGVPGLDFPWPSYERPQ